MADVVSPADKEPIENECMKCLSDRGYLKPTPAEIIDSFRANFYISLEEIERETGISESVLEKMEQGLLPVGPREAEALAEFLGIPAQYLLDSDG